MLASRPLVPPSRRRRGRPARRGRHATLVVVASALLLAASVAAVLLMPAAANAGPPRSVVAEPPEPSAPWEWPIAPPIAVVAPFRAPPTPYSAGHRGIDITAESGDPVVAPAAGVIRFAGPVAGRGVVSIDHGDGVLSAIEPVDATVAAGTEVAPGDVVGAVASGGHCDAVCVHFGVRVDGEYVSPFLFLGGLPRAVLLPMGP
ncbi:M23 family metallopeptidase [Agromyces sp. H66]|uniref:M23 family metallopeptidase n=1 Tax=Agromyces sp. H66 TaxID=2529859 RepID=UPI0010AB2B06|nr:M23 family metallopeptidase [Agromyces sp. H66]